MTDSQRNSMVPPSKFGKLRSILFARNRYAKTIKLLLAFGMLIAAGVILIRGDKLPWLVEMDAPFLPVEEVVQAVATGDGDRLIEAVKRMRHSPKVEDRWTIAPLVAMELRRMDLPEKDEYEIIVAVKRLFPHDAIGETADAKAYASIAGGLWEAGVVEAAVGQSQALIEIVAESWKEGLPNESERIVTRIATGIKKSPIPSGSVQPAAQRILRQLVQRCAPPQNLTSNDHFNVAKSLVTALVVVGDRDTAVSYYQRWLKHAEQTAPAQRSVVFAESVAQRGSRLLETSDQSNALLGILMVTTRTVPHADVGEAWAKYAAAASDEARDQTYRHLLEMNSSATLAAAAQLLPDPPVSASLDEIRRNHFQWIATDMGHLVQSPAFGHLVSVLQDRNAETELDQLTHFFRGNFPRQ